MLFRMVPKPSHRAIYPAKSFRAVLFRMVPKPLPSVGISTNCFRAVLFRKIVEEG